MEQHEGQGGEGCNVHREIKRVIEKSGVLSIRFAFRGGSRRVGVGGGEAI